MHVDGLEQGPEVHALGSAGVEVGNQLAAGFGGDVEVPHLGGHIDQEAQEAGLCVAPMASTLCTLEMGLAPAGSRASAFQC